MPSTPTSTPPIVSVVARSQTGKTTLIEALLPELKAAGLRVAVVKHHHHTSSFDTPGKDTHRMAEAGADLVLGISPVQVATFSREPGSADLDAVIARHCVGYDLVLTEGYKRGVYPKIEVHRSERSSALLCDFDEMLALVTDANWDTDVPQFALDDASGLANLVVTALGLTTGS
jgi:molybdopterin-guanine dinucleotide biosynthesis protein MobB